MISDFIFNLIQRVSFIKKYRLYNFCKKIIFPFLIKNISKLFKDDIDEKLIIMGAYGGGAFIDNPRYLFEFLNKNSNYKLVWIAKLNEVSIELKEKGYYVASFYSLPTIKLLRKAKYIFLSHGVSDILPIEFSPKTSIIVTWHGTQIKKLVGSENLYVYGKWGEIFRLKLKNDKYIDYLLTPTGEKRDHGLISKAFKISPKKILSLGYPKLDLLFNQNIMFITKLKNKYKIPKKIKKIILYCPTWRNDLKLKVPFTSLDLAKLNNFLEEINTLFLIKAHMFVKEISFEDYHNIRIVPKNANIEELYLITDILITDYSSTMFDFSLLDRPIILYAYDLEKYLETRGLYYNLEDIAPGPIYYNAEDLIDGIKNVDKIDRIYKEKRIEIRNRFNKYNDGKSTERILNFLGIKYR
ncbi:MAG: CDP-glycerol glycerophosphotransferase family protein [Candidatus Lokiarchaeia archaeon]